MSKNPDALTKRENQILVMLCERHTYESIRKSLQISGSCLHMHTFNIRQKTGIRNTKDVRQCNAYMLNVKPESAAPTDRQLIAMRLLVKGLTYESIGKALWIKGSTAANLISCGCRRAGVVNAGNRRFINIREYLQRLDIPDNPMDDPMF